MARINLKLLFIFSILVISFVLVNGTSAPAPEKQVVNYFPVTHFGWTVINLDPTLTNDEVRAALAACNVTVDSIVSSAPCHMESWYDGKNIAGVPKYIRFPVGNASNTITLLNYADPALWDRGSNSLGYGGVGSGMVIHSVIDKKIDIGIRIIHEMEHGEGLDPDRLYLNDTERFTAWMTSVNYPYQDFFSNHSKYRTMFGSLRNNGGSETLLNYHRWLITQQTDIICAY